MGRVYATKVDWWIGLVLIFAIVALLGTAVPFFIGPPVHFPFGTGIGVLCIAIAIWTGWIPYSTNYEIAQTELIIRSAGIRWRVPLDSIFAVFPTHNPLSSPACSLDRLRVNYRNRKGRKRFVLISPKEKEDFLRDLAQAIPGLELVGDRPVREGDNN